MAEPFNFKNFRIDKPAVESKAFCDDIPQTPSEIHVTRNLDNGNNWVRAVYPDGHDEITATFTGIMRKG